MGENFNGGCAPVTAGATGSLAPAFGGSGHRRADLDGRQVGGTHEQPGPERRNHGSEGRDGHEQPRRQARDSAGSLGGRPRPRVRPRGRPRPGGDGAGARLRPGPPRGPRAEGPPQRDDRARHVGLDEVGDQGALEPSNNYYPPQGGDHPRSKVWQARNVLNQIVQDNQDQVSFLFAQYEQTNANIVMQNRDRQHLGHAGREPLHVLHLLLRGRVPPDGERRDGERAPEQRPPRVVDHDDHRAHASRTTRVAAEDGACSRGR